MAARRFSRCALDPPIEQARLCGFCADVETTRQPAVPERAIALGHQWGRPAGD
jgi:hypothetical protein